MLEKARLIDDIKVDVKSAIHLLNGVAYFHSVEERKVLSERAVTVENVKVLLTQFEAIFLFVFYIFLHKQIVQQRRVRFGVEQIVYVAVAVGHRQLTRINALHGQIRFNAR